MDFLSQSLISIKSHAHIIFTGLLGAAFGFMLSKEPLRDRWVVFLLASFYVLCLLSLRAIFWLVVNILSCLVLLWVQPIKAPQILF